MKYGIIDLGSNTIKLLIYNTKKNLEVLYEKRIVVGLASYITKDNTLSELGIKAAIDAINNLKKHADNFNPYKLYVVATAAIRNASNSNEIITKIQNKTKLNINLLSGDEEAKYGILGVMHEHNFSNGLIIDIGGGSTEISIINNQESLLSVSLPFGCLNLYVNYVKDILPTETEQEKIKQVILNALEKNKVNQIDIDNIYGIGGTIKALFKLYKSYTNKKKEFFIEDDINILFNKIKLNNKNTYIHLIKVIPERLHTIMPGLIILNTIFDYFNINKIYKSSNGLREGYILKHIS